MTYRLLDEQQLAELERRVSAAEEEQAKQMGGKEIVSGPAMKDIEFQALYLIRRLLSDVKSLSFSVVMPAVVIGPNTQSGYNSKGDYGEYAVPDYIEPKLANAPSPARVALWFLTWDEAITFCASLKRSK